MNIIEYMILVIFFTLVFIAIAYGGAPDWVAFTIALTLSILITE